MKRHPALFIFFGGFLFQLSYIRYGINMLDGGLLLSSATRVLSGQVSMVDFFGYPPGKSSYAALFFMVFGESIGVLRVSMVLVSAGTMVLLFYVCRRMVPFPYSIAPSLFLLAAPGGYHCRFISFFTVLNTLLILRFIDRPGRMRLFISSFLAALTLFFRLDVSLFSLLTLLVVLLIANIQEVKKEKIFRKRVIKLGNGFVFYFLGLFIPWSLLLVYTISNGDFQNQLMLHIKSMANFNNEIAIVDPPNIFDVFKEASVHKKRILFEGALFYFPFILYGAVFLHLIRKRGPGKGGLPFFAVFFLGTQTLLYPFSFPDFWHAITIYPLVFVVSTCLFTRLIAFYEQRCQRKKSLVFLKMLLPCTVLIFFILTSLNYGIVLGSIGERWREHGFLDTPGIQIYLPKEKYEITKNVLAFISQNSMKDDGLFVVPHEAAWYFLSRRKNPTRFDYLLPGHMDPKTQFDIINDLKGHPPKFILYQESSLMGREETKLQNFAPHVEEYIRRNYSPVARYGEYEILERPGNGGISFSTY
ncbi:MAG: hypothetical protein ACE5FU_01510 [Nitrospinota bacterium]